MIQEQSAYVQYYESREGGTRVRSQPMCNITRALGVVLQECALI